MQEADGITFNTLVFFFLSFKFIRKKYLDVVLIAE